MRLLWLRLTSLKTRVVLAVALLFIVFAGLLTWLTLRHFDRNFRESLHQQQFLLASTLAKALALHLAAVLPTAAHTINLDDQYEEDAALQRIEIVEGCSPVPQGPGLGVEVDEAIIKRLAAQGPAEMPRHLGKLRLPAGHVLYSASIPAVDQLTGFAEGTVRGLSFEMWHDDGSEEFERMYERVQAEGTVLE